MVQEEVVTKTYNQLPVVDPDLELRGSGGGGRAAFLPSAIPFFLLPKIMGVRAPWALSTTALVTTCTIFKWDRLYRTYVKFSHGPAH